MIWGFLIQVAIWAVITVVSELLRPKPDLEDAKAASFDEFGFPTTDPERAIPVGWGTFRVTSPGILWYGDYVTEPIEEEVKTGLWSSDDVIIGYRYSIGMHLGIARHIDSYIAVDWDDERLINFSPEIAPGVSGTLVSVDEPDFLGGDEGAGGANGGIVGDWRFYRGGSSQNQNSYLTQFQDLVPNYRHLGSVVWERVYIGTQPAVKPPQFVCTYFPNRLGLTTAQRMIDDGSGVLQANPVEVIYELLVNNDYGLAISTADVNTSNFQGHAITLAGENHGYCNLWTRLAPVGEIINDILRQIDAQLFMEYDSGQFELALIRAEGDSPLPLLDESNIVELEDFTRGNWTETSNRVIVNWKDPFLGTKPSPAVQDDMANERLQGRKVIAPFTYPGISNASLAASVAAREIRGLAYPLAKCTIVANRDAFEFRPGRRFELQWGDLGIASMIMRVASVAVGGAEETRVRLTCAQDVYAIGEVVYAAPAPTGWTNPSISPPVASRADALFEAPLLIDRLAPLTSPHTSSSEEDSRIIMLSVPNQSNVTGFRMMQSNPAGGSPSQPTQLVGDFAAMNPSGLLAHPITQVQFLNPSSPNTITVQEGTDLAKLVSASSNDIQTLLANLFIIDDELFSFETPTINADGTVTLSGIHRAKLDTVPVEHGYGARVYFMGIGTAFSGGISNDRFGSAVVERFAGRPITTKGILPTASANVVEITPTDRVFRPYAPKNLEIAVAGVSPAIPATLFPTDLPRADWLITWDTRSRETLKDLDWDQDTADPMEADTETVIQFRSDSMSPQLRREVVFGPGSPDESYTYTVADQDADFGGLTSPATPFPDQAVRIRVFSRRTSAPQNGLESHGIYDFTVMRGQYEWELSGGADELQFNEGGGVVENAAVFDPTP